MTHSLSDEQGKAVLLLERHGILPGSWIFHHELASLKPDAQRAMAVLTSAHLVEYFGSSARVNASVEPAYQHWKAGVFAEGDLTNEQGKS